jgi:hypothetical protein
MGRPEYYRGEEGWLAVALADRMRADGKTVVSQNLMYGSGESDLGIAEAVGRARSRDELAILRDRTVHGGPSREGWMQAVEDTASAGGYVNVTIRVPRSDKQGFVGHSVLVTGITDGTVRFFDPDQKWQQRYEDNYMELPDIRRVEDTEQLFFEQPADAFVGRMTGEVVHIYVPEREAGAS